MTQTEYVRFFGMSTTPFARNHDPKWLYLCPQHKEAIIKLRWAVQEHGGLALIRGDVGSGKSFLIEYLMSAWPAQFGWRCAKIHNTSTTATARGFLREICMAFGLEPSWSSKEMASRLEEWLVSEVYKTDGCVVIFIDEAQSISSRAMPVIRDLLNLQTGKRPMLEVILSGQMTIDQKLRFYPGLQSRIATIVNLKQLTEIESNDMILHRLGKAGCRRPTSRFPADALHRIYEASDGNPRDIMIIAETAMKEAYLTGCDRITPALIGMVSDDLALRTRKRKRWLAEDV